MATAVDLQLLELAPPTQLASLLPPLMRALVPFDEAWDRALARVVWPVSAREEREWRAQLEATRMAWMTAYEGQHATREESMAGSLCGAVDAESEFADAA